MSWTVGKLSGAAVAPIQPQSGEPTLQTTGPRVSLAGAGATLTPTWSGGEVVINVGDNWQNAVSSNPAGTVFRVKTGVHRRTCIGVAPKNGMQFIGESGAIVSGAVDIGNTGWTQAGSVWHKTNASWPATVDGGVGPGAFDSGYEAMRYREDLFVDKTPLQRLGSGGTGGAASYTTTPGASQWSYDSSTKTIYLGQDPVGHTIEVSFDMDGYDRMMTTNTGGSQEKVVLKNLTIEGYATGNQDGAIFNLDAGGDGTSSGTFPMNTAANGYDYTGATPEGGSSPSLGGWLIDHCQIRLCHSGGIYLGPGSILQNSIIDNNGQIGAKGAGRNVKVLKSIIRDNNYSHYNVFVEAGGFKAWNVTNLTIADSQFLRNRGPGAWLDYTWDGHIIEYCSFVDGLECAISSEMTEGCEVRYCQFLGNCNEAWITAQTDPDYSANYYTAQVWGYNSRNYNVHHNYIDTKATGWGGIALQEQERGGVSPLSQGTGAGATSGPYSGLRATCAGTQFQHNSVWIRSVRQGNAAGWRGIVTMDYGAYGDVSTTKAVGWLLRTGTDIGGTGSYAYTLTIDNNFYHLPLEAKVANTNPNLQSGISSNYAWYPFRWDGQWNTQLIVPPSPYTATNLYDVLDSGRRFGNFTQWSTPLAAAGVGTGGFGADINSYAAYDQ